LIQPNIPVEKKPTINRIDLLVHPDFLRIWHCVMNPDLPLHNKQSALRRAWHDRIGQVIEEPETAMVHLTYLTREDLQRGTGNPDTLDNEGKRTEVARIRHCRYQLGPRHFVVTQAEPFPTPESIRNAGFSFHPEQISLRGYGEVQHPDWCVDSCTDLIAGDLGITRVTIDPQLSLTESEYIEIEEWAESFGQS
jgi:hypothetical protein